MRKGNLFGLGSPLVEHTGSESAVLLFGRGLTRTLQNRCSEIGHAYGYVCLEVYLGLGTIPT